MYCAKCGKELDSGVKFCTNCGAPATSQKAAAAAGESGAVRLPKSKNNGLIVGIVAAVLLFTILGAVVLIRGGGSGGGSICGTYESLMGTLVLEKDKTYSWNIYGSTATGPYTVENDRLSMTVEGLDLTFRYVRKDGLLIFYGDTDVDLGLNLLGVDDGYGVVFYKLDKNGKQITTDSIKTATALTGTYADGDGTSYTFYKDGSFDVVGSWMGDSGLYFAEGDEITLIISGVATRYTYTLQDGCLTLSDGTSYWQTGEGKIFTNGSGGGASAPHSAVELIGMSWSEVKDIYGDDCIYQLDGDHAYYYYESGCPYNFFVNGENIWEVQCWGNYTAGAAPPVLPSLFLDIPACLRYNIFSEKSDHITKERLVFDMAKDQRNVEAITPMEEDFAKWYTDICLKAELVDYASVKGFLILRPYGYAIWENIQKYMDAEFKKTGHVNVAMPVLIPESLLKKEGELVEGFAPEVAWVTHGGSEPLEERLAFRPTSETMFCDHWSHVLHSYRELPMLYNQWCSVIRWEKTTRPFLRSREFWWQEGHTIHETAAEAEAETEQQLNCYADVCRNALAMPVVKGRKTDKEKFAGAEATYTIECMMKDHKALQSGTSHFFGDKFSRAYDVTFTGRDNTLQYPFQTSWGASTRLIGAIIMTHSDNHGLVLPPVIAPTQVVVIPIAQHKEGVLEAAAGLRDRLTAAGIRVSMDDSDQSAGWKFAQYEMKGVPLRVEIGPKDMEKGQCCIARRDTGEKTFVPLTELESAVQQLLQDVHDNLYAMAEKNLEDNTFDMTSWEEVKEMAQGKGGFARTKWCGSLECELAMKEKAGVSSRCMPLKQSGTTGKCVVCGKECTTDIYWGVAY